MQTQYSSGRLSLPVPSIVTLTSGTIQGGGNTYYFWTKARNRVGFNNPSTVKSLVVNNNSRIRIDSTTFNQFSYEDWRYFVVSVSNINDFSTSRVIYKQDIYESDQTTLKTLSNVTLDNDYIFNGDVNIPTIPQLPLNVPNGFRVNLLSLGKVYEFIVDSSKEANNLTVISGSGGNWELVDSNSLIETSNYCNKELYQVTEDELIAASIEILISDSLPLKFYIVNDSGTSFTSGELDLNEYVSDKSLSVTYGIKLIGYLNLTTNVLDTTGIDNINTVIYYPEDKLQISKALPNNSAYVIELYPEIANTDRIVSGTQISVYPKLNDYTIIESVKYYGDPAIDIATLKAIPSSLYKNNQVRFVYSKQTFYYFDETSTLADNGDSVLLPNDNPVTGRWKILTFSIPDGSITLEKLDDAVLETFQGNIETEVINLTNSTDLVINLDTSTFDYFIINCPNEDGDSTTINVTATLTNKTTKAVIIELRQKTGVVSFDNSLIFPSGSIPTFSGNNKTDLFVICLVRDDLGVTKKRIFLAQKDI
jgi:hypothetical protein